MFHDLRFLCLINKYFYFALSQYGLIAADFPGYYCYIKNLIFYGNFCN